MDVEKMKELIAEREAIDAQLVAIVTGIPGKVRKTQQCSKCGQEGHSARTCIQKPLTTNGSMEASS